MSDDADELAPQASEEDFDTEPIVVPVAAAAERVTLPWLQPPPPRRHRPGRAWIVGAVAAVVVVVVAAAVWYVWRPGGSTADETDSAAAVSDQVEDDLSAAQVVLDLVAPRHPSGACAPVSTESEAVAVVVRCSDDRANAPRSATYSLAESPAELGVLFDELVGDLRVVTCPGNIQSPGAWRRAGSTTPAGTLVCGTRGEVPTVAWTTDGDELLSVVSTDPGPRSLEMLYAWWSQNS